MRGKVHCPGGWTKPWTTGRVALVLAAVLLTATGAVAAREPDTGSLDAYLDMPLEDLLNLEVTSVGKKSQRLTDAAAAVHVITQEDIRRSGATSIPDLLRMVPGVSVARINQHQWAISARGFGRMWANKLLVLLDGRSIYTPFFGGVYWDVQDTLLEDIDRIEVIRGPGGTLWGANAVNGVINIITKHSADTRGNMALLRYGNEERGTAAFRHGGRLGGDGDYRVYGKLLHRADSHQVGGGNHDQMRFGQAGFRVDRALTGSDEVTFQGDLYSGEADTSSPVASLSPPGQSQVGDSDQTQGVNLLGRWQHRHADGSVSTLQGYFDRTERDNLLLAETRNTFDIDFQHRSRPHVDHELVWGLGYRYTVDDTRGSFVTSVLPADRGDHLFSAFLQDEITLVPNHTRLVLGSKIEHNDYTGVELQPSARLLWTPSERESWWAAVSRAVHVPSRFESDAQIQNVIGLPPPWPTVLRVSGSDQLDAEELIAYELGYRAQPRKDLDVDLALFYNDYQNLLALQAGASGCQPSGGPPPCIFPDTHFLIPFGFVSAMTGEVYGAELAADWRATDWWRLKAAYSYLQIQLHSSTGSARDEYPEGESPHHQASLRSSMNLAHDTELDLWLRYADHLPAASVPSYLTLDTRLAWRPRKGMELSLVGRNLLEKRHREFVEVQSAALPVTEVERSVYGQVRVDF